MAFVRRKVVRGVARHYLVESRREHGQVRQKVLAYLGPCRTVEEALEFWSVHAKQCRTLAATPQMSRRAQRAERRVEFLRRWRSGSQRLRAKVAVGTTLSEGKRKAGGVKMFNVHEMPAVKKALATMEEANREAWRLEKESVPAAEADFKKADEVYQNAAATAVRFPAARGKLAEAEAARDDARRSLDGVRRAAELAKLEGQRLTDAYSGAISTAKREEAQRLMAEARAKFHEIAARWNGFAASVRELVLIKKALSDLGEEGRMPFVSVAQQLNYWAAGRFVLDGMVRWELEE